MISAVDCLIALGSNIGDKAAHLRFALRALDKLPGTRLVRASSFHRTSPVGVKDQPDFLNAAAWLRTRLPPMGLLVQLKRLEAARGRRPGRRWGPRPLDLDILSYGKLKVRGPFLRIPHPRALRRRFVLAPLAELRPRAAGTLRTASRKSLFLESGSSRMRLVLETKSLSSV